MTHLYPIADSVLSEWTVSFGMSDFSVQTNELKRLYFSDQQVLDLPLSKPSTSPCDSSRDLGRDSFDSLALR